jgi:hypothetical protein
MTGSAACIRSTSIRAALPPLGNAETATFGRRKITTMNCMGGLSIAQSVANLQLNISSRLSCLPDAFERPPPAPAPEEPSIGTCLGQIGVRFSKLPSIGSMQWECGNFANVGSPQKKLPQARLPQSASDRNRQQSLAAALTASIFSAL